MAIILFFFFLISGGKGKWVMNGWVVACSGGGFWVLSVLGPGTRQSSVMELNFYFMRCMGQDAGCIYLLLAAGPATSKIFNYLHMRGEESTAQVIHNPRNKINKN